MFEFLSGFLGGLATPYLVKYGGLIPWLKKTCLTPEFIVFVIISTIILHKNKIFQVLLAGFACFIAVPSAVVYYKTNKQKAELMVAVQKEKAQVAYDTAKMNFSTALMEKQEDLRMLGLETQKKLDSYAAKTTKKIQKKLGSLKKRLRLKKFSMKMRGILGKFFKRGFSFSSEKKIKLCLTSALKSIIGGIFRLLKLLAIIVFKILKVLWAFPPTRFLMKIAFLCFIIYFFKKTKRWLANRNRGKGGDAGFAKQKADQYVVLKQEEEEYEEFVEEEQFCGVGGLNYQEKKTKKHSGFAYPNIQQVATPPIGVSPALHIGLLALVLGVPQHNIPRFITAYQHIEQEIMAGRMTPQYLERFRNTKGYMLLPGEKLYSGAGGFENVAARIRANRIIERQQERIDRRRERRKKPEKRQEEAEKRRKEEKEQRQKEREENSKKRKECQQENLQKLEEIRRKKEEEYCRRQEERDRKVEEHCKKEEEREKKRKERNKKKKERQKQNLQRIEQEAKEKEEEYRKWQEERDRKLEERRKGKEEREEERKERNKKKKKRQEQNLRRIEQEVKEKEEERRRREEDRNTKLEKSRQEEAECRKKEREVRQEEWRKKVNTAHAKKEEERRRHEEKERQQIKDIKEIVEEKQRREEAKRERENFAKRVHPSKKNIKNSNTSGKMLPRKVKNKVRKYHKENVLQSKKNRKRSRDKGLRRKVQISTAQYRFSNDNIRYQNGFLAPAPNRSPDANISVPNRNGRTQIIDQNNFENGTGNGGEEEGGDEQDPHLCEDRAGVKLGVNIRKELDFLNSFAPQLTKEATYNLKGVSNKLVENLASKSKLVMSIKEMASVKLLRDNTELPVLHKLTFTNLPESGIDRVNKHIKPLIEQAKEYYPKALEEATIEARKTLEKEAKTKANLSYGVGVGKQFAGGVVASMVTQGIINGGITAFNIVRGKNENYNKVAEECNESLKGLQGHQRNIQVLKNTGKKTKVFVTEAIKEAPSTKEVTKSAVKTTAGNMIGKGVGFVIGTAIGAPSLVAQVGGVVGSTLACEAGKVDIDYAELGCQATGAAIGSCLSPIIGTIIGGFAGKYAYRTIKNIFW